MTFPSDAPDSSVPLAAFARLDVLLGEAVALTADRWDDVSALVQEAMGIVLQLVAQHPAATAALPDPTIPTSAQECVAIALAEARGLDLELVATYPDLSRLRIVLVEADHALTHEGLSR